MSLARVRTAQLCNQPRTCMILKISKVISCSPKITAACASRARPGQAGLGVGERLVKMRLWVIRDNRPRYVLPRWTSMTMSLGQRRPLILLTTLV